MRIKIIRQVNPYNEGQVVELPEKQAELLIKSGIAIISKDMTNFDIKET
jgi:hypothetical protein